MKFELNLFENSIEYFFDSLDFYVIANEHGEHGQQRSALESKKKWKLAFVFIVQAIELLMKEILYRINPALISESIDNPASESNKTVSFSKLIIRFNNLTCNSLSTEEMRFLNSCANIRNTFVHYKVEISSPELKSKYCELLSIFVQLHAKFFKIPIEYKTSDYSTIVQEIIDFAAHYTVFRDKEYILDHLEIIKDEIEFNKRNAFYIDHLGVMHQRIKFGEENEILAENGHLEIANLSYSKYDFCPDCLAKKGEYHLDGCDCEICPICFGSAICCDCEVNLCDEYGNVYLSPYSMK